MKFLVYLVSILLVGTAIAQNPTIVQGNYITNVFGPSNFIRNPNARNGTEETSVVNATITRSTTTPLVATTEFNVTTSSATGSISWTPRNFDAGMKNQNCELRFTYRGFTVGTTTAQITQNSVVVAQLDLVGDSTNPRQVSLNFPCGDLTYPSIFVLQQSSASLTGTNEIGGIYMGLATNMANVAQAEFVGAVKWTATANCTWLFNNTSSYTSFAADSDCTTPAGSNIEGQASAPSSKIPSIKFNNLKPGRYVITATGAIQSGGGSPTTAQSFFAYYRFHDGTTAAKNENSLYATRINGSDGPGVPVITGEFEYTSSQSNVTFQIQGKTNIGSPTAAYVVIDNIIADLYISVYRFPLSSELVVTPERQNWYVSAYHIGANPDLGLANVSSKTEITNGSLTLTPDTGSQPVSTLCASGNNPSNPSTGSTTCAAGNESLGLTFNIPSVGSYEVCSQFSSYTAINAAANIGKYFSLEETSTSSSTQLTTNKTTGLVNYAGSSSYEEFTPVSLCQIFRFSSIGQKSIRLFYSQSVGGTPAASLILADDASLRAVRWSIKPVTNQSNSALYVQGPVKAAETGAAIPAGYVGEVVEQATATAYVATTAANTEVDIPNATITLGVGVWELEYFVDVSAFRNITGVSAIYGRVRVTDSSNNGEPETESLFGLIDTASSQVQKVSTVAKRKRITITSGTKTFKLRLACSVANTIGICEAYNTGDVIGITGSDSASFIRAVRIN